MNARQAPPQTVAEAKIAADYVGARLSLPGGDAVAKLRDAAFDAFMAAGLPTRRVEAWHYTDLKRAMAQALPMAVPPAATSIPAQGARLDRLSPRRAGVESLRIVLVDGQPVRSCVVPAGSVVGQEITTLEGLGTIEAPSRLQQAFIDEQAAQCGYCLNGMIMASQALLSRNPKPSEQDVRHALDGNLCRCGVHNRIVRAVMRASREA